MIKKKGEKRTETFGFLLRPTAKRVHEWLWHRKKEKGAIF